MKSLLLSALMLLIFSAGQALADDPVILTQWTFDGTLDPAIGEGTASHLGGTTTHSTTLSSGWRITDFPDQFEGSGTAGAEFMVSTVGKNNINITFSNRSSGTMSRWAEFQYTIDGGDNWLVFGNNDGGLSPHDTVYDFALDFSEVAGVNNNPNFGFRFVSIFSPVAFNPENPDQVFEANTAYHRARTEGSGGNEYRPGGNWRLLNVTVLSGEFEEPEPFTLWTFDETLEPAQGQGTANLLGGTSTHSTTTGNGWRITNYPDQFVGSGTAGAEFMVPTTGFENLLITFGHRSSGTMSRWAEFQYTIDGGDNWLVFGNNEGGLSPHDTVYDMELDFSTVEGVNNNPDFGFRVVSIFSPIAFNPENPDQEFAANTAYHRARTLGSGGNEYGGAGNWRLLNMSFFGDVFTGTSIDPYDEFPVTMSLNQNYPNPFNPTTNITFELNESSNVRLDVFNVQGQRVATLVNNDLSAGSHTISFDASNLSSGMYLYRLTSNNTSLIKKMTLIK